MCYGVITLQSYFPCHIDIFKVYVLAPPHLKLTYHFAHFCFLEFNAVM